MTTTRADRRRAAGSVCAYCGEEKLTGTQAPEHPIPAALQSKITVYTVCDDCNAETGRHVDQPWLKHFFVQAERARVGVSDPRHPGDSPSDPLLNRVYEDEDGHIVEVRDGVPHYIGSIVETDDKFTITAETQERIDELLPRVLKRLEAQEMRGADFQVTRRRHRPRLTTMLTMSSAIGVRMGAKLGLAFGAEAFPEEWRLSPHAEQLREWLWSDEPTDADGERISWIGGRMDEEDSLGQPPEHLGYFSVLGQEVCLVALIFGTTPLIVPVAPADTARPRIAWRSGPSHRGPVVTTFDAVLLDAARRRGVLDGAE